MNVKDVQELLPHRYPFLLVDRVTDLVQGESIQAYKNVTINEPFFTGHFPGEPIMPGVLIIEAMAQVAGVLGFKAQPEKANGDFIYVLCGVDKARFKRQVVPGDRLDMHVKLVTTKRNILKFSGEASVDDNLVASAEFMVAEQKV